MRHLRTIGLVPTVALAMCLSLLGLTATPVAAVPQAAQAAMDRARLQHALESLDEAEQSAASSESRIREASAELDRLLYEQKQAQETLNARARAIYRSGEDSLLWALLGADSLQDLATRWDLMTRIAKQDSDNLDALKTARTDAEKTARSLIALQAEQARAVDEAAHEVASARKQLASSEAALREYEARLAAKAKPVAEEPPTEKPKADPTQGLHGSGEWQTGVASHYGRSFTGRGASGVEIGPYSMIVAHRTLPFGTLVEVEYNGKRAVASVEDRGPHVEGREFDLGPGLVRVLDFAGVDEVRYRVIK